LHSPGLLGMGSDGFCPRGVWQTLLLWKNGQKTRPSGLVLMFMKDLHSLSKPQPLWSRWSVELTHLKRMGLLELFGSHKVRSKTAFIFVMSDQRVVIVVLFSMCSPHLSSPYLLNEAFTDTWTVILHSHLDWHMLLLMEEQICTSTVGRT
jgi:hypothetical protein